MSELFISVRITESFFTSEEINLIKEHLNNCVNRSDFIRKAIKTYLRQEHNIKVKEIRKKNNNINNLKEINEIRHLLKQNHKLLIDLKNNDNNFKNEYEEEIYEGDEQKLKTEQVLSLISQF